MRQVPAFQIAVGFQRKGGAALVAQLLNVNVVAHQLHIGGRRGVLLGRKRRAQHIAQADNQPVGVLGFAGAHQPAQRAEGVVQEMRVDLRLQHFVAGVLQKQLLFVVFVDQRVDLTEHRVHIAGQRADFIRRGRCRQHGAGGGKVAALHALDGLA